MNIFAGGRVVAVDVSPLAESRECIFFPGLLTAYVVNGLFSAQG